MTPTKHYCASGCDVLGGERLHSDSTALRLILHPRHIGSNSAALPRMPSDHQRSDAARSYRHLYGSTHWRRGRALFLAQHPLCRRCTDLGRVTAATVVNHIVPHRGDWSLFRDWDNWEPLCKPHHDGIVQSEERSGWLRGSGPDGRPRDPGHPWNAARR